MPKKDTCIHSKQSIQTIFRSLPGGATMITGLPGSCSNLDFVIDLAAGSQGLLNNRASPSATICNNKISLNKLCL